MVGQENDLENGIPMVVLADASDTKEKEKKNSKKQDEKKDDEEEEMIGFCQFYRYATATDALLIFVGLIFAIVKGVSWPIIMVIFGEMIETLGTVEQDPDSKSLTQHMLGFAYWYIGMGFLQIVAGYFASALLNISSERQATKIRRHYFAAMLRQECAWYDTMSSGELTTRLMGDVEKIRDGLSDKSGLFVQWFFCFVGGLLIAFLYSWQLSLVILATAPLMGGASAFFAKLLADYTAEELNAYAAAGAVAEEVIGAIRTVVSFGGETTETNRYKCKLDKILKQGKWNQFLYAMSLGSTYLIMYMTYALAFWYGAKLTGDRSADPADVIISFFNVMIGAWGLGFCAPQWKIMSVGRGAALRVYKTIDRKSAINHEDEDGETIPTFEGRIEFRNCQFHYPTRPDVQVMQDFSMVLEPGKTHALVGPSGCGKSTAVSLIERFYDVLGGEILLDGVDLRKINLRWLRDQIGLVGQEPVLFSTTIEENIRYGREGISQDDIETACKLAFAHDFISKLPEGYQTLCGERGAQMSGGQKQRIAIARALVRDPKILLLDEATSALDNKSEKIVQKALDKARQGRTTLIIAHRLSTIRDVDKICAVAEGKVVEEGGHEDLMKCEGLYHSLVTYQQAVQDGENEEVVAVTSSTDLEKLSSEKAESGKSSATTVPTAWAPEVEIVGSKKTDEVEPATFIEIVRECEPYEVFLMVLGSFGAALNGVTMPIFAVLFSNVLFDLISLALDAEAKAGGAVIDLDYGPTNKWAIYFALLGLLAGVSYFVQVYCMGVMSETFTRRLRIRSFNAILRQNLEFFDQPSNSIGALTTRLSTEASSVKDAAGPRIAVIIQVIVGMTAGVLIALIANWKLALVCIACVPFIVAGGIVQMWQVTGTTKGVAKLYESSGKTAAESIENIRTVASLGLEKKFYCQYTTALKLPKQAAQKKAHIIGVCMGLSEAITFFTFAAVFAYGAKLMEDKETSFDDVMKVFSGIIFSAMIVGEAMSYLGDYTKATMAAGKIFKLIYSEPPIDAYSDAGLKDFAVSGDLRFDNVHFTYPTRPDQPVLQGLSFSAPRGYTVALVGQSGCGKSTTIQLTERFYNTLAGTLSLDGTDVTEINVSFLRKQLGLVSQEPILFDTTIADNIKYGDLTREVSTEEMVAAAKSANIHDFISSLPQGYETSVGERGAQLSGGQKQRVAIARALVRDPKVLLLDEATSALDTESEKIVQEALDKARQGRTCLVIAHRLSTIHTADLICVIEDGAVVEQGSHHELMAKRGIYFTLNAKDTDC